MNRKIGITKTKLNLRTGPGKEYDVLHVLESGATIVVLHDLGPWLNVQAAGATGFVQEEYVTLSGQDQNEWPAGQDRPADPIARGVVLTYLNLRRGPGIEQDVIRTLEQGAVLDVLEDLEDWLKIHFAGSIGYVMEKFIDWQAPEPGAVPPEPEPAPEPAAEAEPAPEPGPQLSDQESEEEQEPGEAGHLAIAEALARQQAGLHTYGTLDQPGTLFAGPGREYPALLEIPAGQPFRVLEDVGAWLNVLAGSRIGYLPQAGAAMAVKSFGRMLSPQDLRSGPGTEYESLLPLLSGETVEILEDLGSWLEISVEKKRGFIPESAIERPPAVLIETDGRPGSPPVDEEVPFFLPAAPAGPSLAPKETLAVDPQAPLAARLIADTWSRYGGLVQEIADSLRLDPGVAHAVLAVEAGGRCFGPDGRMIIRFENHVFWHFWGKQNQAAFDRHFQFDPEFPWRGHRTHAGGQRGWQEVHASDQAAEWQAYELAAALDRTSARLSTSMGAPQIMGFNYEALGFESVHEMWAAFAAGEKQQIAGFFNFLKAQELLAALRAGDFVGFARRYNGDGLAEKYGGRILEGVGHFDELAVL